MLGWDGGGFDSRSRLGRTLKGKWQLNALLGEGGMAAVYAATHRAGARVAIKVLHPRLCLDDDVRRRFRREAYVANAVNHPHAVSIVDDDVDEDGTPFLVMELLAGHSVEDLRRASGGKLDPRLVCAIALGVLRVLEAAHEQGIVHRDIKPSNLFLAQDGHVRVFDFGVAACTRGVAGESFHTRDGALLGTPGFMAPEQARSHWDEVDARSDLWALGATMFTLLSGEPVHRAHTPNEQLGLAMTASARSVREVMPELLPDLARVVDRALAYRPEGRFPNARSMRAALEASPDGVEQVQEQETAVPVTLTQAPTLAAVESKSPTARRARDLRRGLWIMAPLAILALFEFVFAGRSRSPGAAARPSSVPVAAFAPSRPVELPPPHISTVAVPSRSEPVAVAPPASASVAVPRRVTAPRASIPRPRELLIEPDPLDRRL